LNSTEIAKKGGVLLRTTAGSSMNSGFIQATLDTQTNVPDNFKWAGHTFGLYGQGDLTMPANGRAFMWQPPSTNTHSVMVSIFPYDGTSIGLTSG
jgi:hypothetical protein